MTTEDLLQRLDTVRSRGIGRWVARCPGHADKSPSLSIAEADDGRILLHDFGGCTPRQIVAALGLELRDLFANAPLPRGRGPRPKSPRLDRLVLAFRFELAALDRRFRVEMIHEVATGIDLSTLSDEELDLAIRHVARAYADQDRADLFENVADTLRERDFTERISRERQTRAA